ncbi:histone-lysine N-methyltransferase SETMAR-like [Pseudomyrmex gracilis]|uniref:histone-lysine N-methyltransferase SETMAR-like n=1 Tax=Pseudomyrmex gracilis TaxID=219809 RepID=UPI000995C650|nr:histone-lysine N-methyltransferase SETMAR-like [Pseudomyrmex gracilis]
MDRLKKLGMVKKLDVWAPHELSEKNIMDRILMCESLLKQNSLDPFLKRIITGDEKWVVYNNIKRRKSWCDPGESSQTVAKLNLHPQKSFGWEMMQHPPYSPDLAPSDYHLFRSLQNNVDGHQFDSIEAIRNHLVDFFAHKSQGFYKNGIKALPKRLQQVVDQDGQHIMD